MRSLPRPVAIVDHGGSFVPRSATRDIAALYIAVMRNPFVERWQGSEGLCVLPFTLGFRGRKMRNLILRWRGLSRCSSPQVQYQHTIRLLIQSINMEISAVDCFTGSSAKSWKVAISKLDKSNKQDFEAAVDTLLEALSQGEADVACHPAGICRDVHSLLQMCYWTPSCQVIRSQRAHSLPSYCRAGIARLGWRRQMMGSSARQSLCGVPHSSTGKADIAVSPHDTRIGS